MNIFYTSDDNFVPQLGAGICSVCENNREMAEITFYIGALRITPEHQAALEALGGRYGRSVVCLPLDDLRQSLGFDFDTLGWSEIVLARLLADRLLPESVERVLYLDGDTIVRENLAPLWATDMGGCPIAASIEPTVNRARRASLGLEALPYFNSGVLLMDLKRWREEQTGQKILTFYRDRGANLFAPDQDAINGALAGHICVLSPKYNFYNIFWYYPYRVLCKLEAPAPYLPEDVFREAVAHPAIIHYLGEDRPWRHGNTHKYAADYQRYLALTPWKDAPMEGGWERYFFCYKAFLTVLKPFPMLRYKIIDALIPAFMRRRKRQRLKGQK